MNGRKYADCYFCCFYHKKDSDEPCKSCNPCEGDDRLIQSPTNFKKITDFEEFMKGVGIEMRHEFMNFVRNGVFDETDN